MALTSHGDQIAKIINSIQQDAYLPQPPQKKKKNLIWILSSFFQEKAKGCPLLTQLSGKNDSDNDQESSNATHGNLTNGIPGFCFQDS